MIKYFLRFYFLNKYFTYYILLIGKEEIIKQSLYSMTHQMVVIINKKGKSVALEALIGDMLTVPDRIELKIVVFSIVF